MQIQQIKWTFSFIVLQTNETNKKEVEWNSYSIIWQIKEEAKAKEKKKLSKQQIEPEWNWFLIAYGNSIDGRIARWNCLLANKIHKYWFNEWKKTLRFFYSLLEIIIISVWHLHLQGLVFFLSVCIISGEIALYKIFLVIFFLFDEYLRYLNRFYFCYTLSEL